MVGKPFFTFNALGSSVGEINIYGEIASKNYWWDEDVVTAKEFKKQLDSLGNVETINVYINSPGGDVFTGQAIHSMLKRHDAHVNVYVDGLAASIASVIAMAGNTIHMPRNAMLMIHNPWTFAFGNAKDFRKTADDLDKIRDSILETYLSQSPEMNRDELINLLDNETWLTAQEALDLGLIDEITEENEVAASISDNLFNRYKNVPQCFKTVQREASSLQQPNNQEREKIKLQLELLNLV
ncbi:Clp protease ClpP [Bacillus cytotoxicus]|nr:Clp protease ClpP [Bacillus cytotoxicus]